MNKKNNVGLLSCHVNHEKDKAEQEHDEAQHLTHPSRTGCNDDNKEEHEEEEPCRIKIQDL